MSNAPTLFQSLHLLKFHRNEFIPALILSGVEESELPESFSLNAGVTQRSLYCVACADKTTEQDQAGQHNPNTRSV